METKPVKSEEDYQAALEEIESLFFAEPGTNEGDRLEVLVALVKDYENKQFFIPDPDPIEAIKFHMERLDLTRKDLEPYLGSRGRVSEVLNRKRPLTISMIRRLQEGLGIPASILVKDYPLNVGHTGDNQKPRVKTLTR